MTFGLLLLFNIAWLFGAAASDWARSKPEPGLNSSGRALAATAAVAELRDRISIARSATSALDQWCVEHRMAPGHAVVADKQADRIVTPSAQLARRLAAAAEPVRFRQVELRCGSHALSSARLWYVPSRLPPAIEASLHQTDTPFGRAVAPLKLVRTTIASTRFWPTTSTTPADQIPAVLFRQTALLVRADGAPVAYVVEDYRRGVLEFAVEPEPTR